MHVLLQFYKKFVTDSQNGLCVVCQIGFKYHIHLGSTRAHHWESSMSLTLRRSSKRKSLLINDEDDSPSTSPTSASPSISPKVSRLMQKFENSPSPPTNRNASSSNVTIGTGRQWSRTDLQEKQTFDGTMSQELETRDASMDYPSQTKKDENSWADFSEFSSSPLSSTPTNLPRSRRPLPRTKEQIDQDAANLIQRWWRRQRQKKKLKLGLEYVYISLQRKRVIQQMFQSEKVYVTQLAEIINSYLTPVTAYKHLSMDEINNLFSNVKEIAEFHSNFLIKFSNKMRSNPGLISDLFLELVPTMVLYQEYNRTHEANMVSQLMDGHKKFSQFVNKSVTSKVEDGRQHLTKLISLPVQKVSLYQYGLKELSIYTLPSHPDYQGTKLACESVKNAIRFMHKKGKVHTSAFHNLVEKTFERPQFCFHCLRLMLDEPITGYQCTYCQGTVHKGCSRKVMEEDACSHPSAALAIINQTLKKGSVGTTTSQAESDNEERSRSRSRKKSSFIKKKQLNESDGEDIVSGPPSRTPSDSHPSFPPEKSENVPTHTGVPDSDTDDGASGTESDRPRERRVSIFGTDRQRKRGVVVKADSSATVVKARRSSSIVPMVEVVSSVDESKRTELEAVPAHVMDVDDSTAEELSKEDESAMSWVTKLKKAQKSRLFTINNTSAFSFDRGNFHESKGRWRRKPPPILYSNCPTQFGAEGRVHPEGSVSYRIEGINSPLIFHWTVSSTTSQPSISFTLPVELQEKLTVVMEARVGEKFCDVKFDVRNKNAHLDVSNANVGRTPSRTEGPVQALQDGTSRTSSSSSLSSSLNSSEITSVNAPTFDHSFSLKSNVEQNKDRNSIGVATEGEYSGFKYTTYDVSKMSAGHRDDDSEEEDDVEEQKKKKLLNSIKLVDPAEVKTTPEELKNAMAHLRLNTNTPPSANSRRRRQPNPIQRNDEDYLVAVSQVPPSESEPDDGSTPAPLTHTPIMESEAEEEAEVDVDGRTKGLMMSAFARLEGGNFTESLRDVNMTLRYFVSISNPKDKQREAKICVLYKFALQILISRKGCTDDIRVARLTRHLSEIPLQPKHRIICMRMAVKSNMEVQNFATASRLLSVLLPLNLVDQSKLQELLNDCIFQGTKDKHHDTIECPCCSQPASDAFDRCIQCQHEFLVCRRDVEIIKTSNYFRCSYCDSTFCEEVGKTIVECPMCKHGKLEEGVGKSSLIIAFLTDAFQPKLVKRIPPATVSPQASRDKVITEIIDTEGKTSKDTGDEIKKASVVCVVAPANNPEAIRNIRERWLPFIQEMKPKVPVVVVVSQRDLQTQESPELEHSLQEIMTKHPEVETCVESSAKHLSNIQEVFVYAQNAVLYPSAPLVNRASWTPSEQCNEAIDRLFFIIDKDGDNALNQTEVESFFKLAFNYDCPKELMDQLSSYQEQNGSVEDYVIDDGEKKITRAGMRCIMGNLVTSGRFQDFWLAMQRFGHDLDLKDLRPEVKSKPQGLARHTMTWGQLKYLEQFVSGTMKSIAKARVAEILAKSPNGSNIEGPFTLEASEGMVPRHSYRALMVAGMRVHPDETYELLGWLGEEEISKKVCGNVTETSGYNRNMNETEQANKQVTLRETILLAEEDLGQKTLRKLINSKSHSRLQSIANSYTDRGDYTLLVHLEQTPRSNPDFYTSVVKATDRTALPSRLRQKYSGKIDRLQVLVEANNVNREEIKNHKKQIQADAKSLGVSSCRVRYFSFGEDNYNYSVRDAETNEVKDVSLPHILSEPW
ncbi:mitochondrial Rho GTPase 2-like [Planoprotostelium fungivorum]|uniref:Mitochondrial Rho GTPase 2-like n=1 Tax=Planoprotostelium fungivorum TaxID=1890364 RepID=A0A2P6MP67_9EUKA|nr:mitochondrial Rho GTPase 2-like [Planoprotostelium fungivorum]